MNSHFSKAWQLLLLASILLSSSIQAAELVVDTLDDAGPGSLREAIGLANANPGADTIVFDPTLNGGAIVLQSALPDIAGELNIVGPGAEQLSINGNQAHQIFSVESGALVTISGLSLLDGSNQLGGGAILNQGTLVIIESVLTGNQAEFGGGGAIDNLEGQLTIVASTISGNEANFGGGLSNFDGSVLILESTISGNFALQGGGIENSGELTIERSTIDGNDAELGGGIENLGNLSLLNTTISANAALETGGGIDNFGGSVSLVHVTMALNQAEDGGSGIWSGANGQEEHIVNIKNTIIADGCFVETPTAWQVSGNNLATQSDCEDLTLVSLDDIKLETLADNGGPTLTHALSVGSLALDAVTDCTGLDGVTPIAEDQRGTSRPQGSQCDIGAYERILAEPPGDVIFSDRFEQGGGG